jgi:hypothetical protein
MITDTRTYIKARIASVSRDYKEIDDPIGDDDLSRAQLDTRYKILFADLGANYTGNSYFDEVPFSVELYKKAGKEVTAQFDSIYETAILIKNAIINPFQVKNQEGFTDIIVSSIVPESLQTNDKTFKVTINLTVRHDFTFTE